jgi:ribosomal protein L37AE/L43A
MALVRSEFPEILEERTPSVTPPTNSQKVRTCADCGGPTCLRPTSRAVIGQCAACGAEHEGETAIQVQVVTAETHKEFKRLEPYGSVRPH